MASIPTIVAFPPRAPRPLTAASAVRRPLDRDAAFRHVSDARRRLLPREERFAHLKRQHD